MPGLFDQLYNQGYATPQTPEQIRSSTGGGLFDQLYNQSTPTVSAPSVQETIQTGIVEPQRRVVPGQVYKAPEDAGLLERAVSKAGEFTWGTAPDILARGIAAKTGILSGGLGSTEDIGRQIIADAQNTINMFNSRITDAEAKGDTARADRLRTSLADSIQKTNDLLGEDIFQAPTPLQTAGALATVAAGVAAPFVPARFATTKAIGTMLKPVVTKTGVELAKAGTMRAAGGLGRAALETGLVGAPFGAAFMGGEKLAETGDLSQAATSAIVGAPFGFALGAAMPPVMRSLGLFGSKVISPMVETVDKAMGGKLRGGLMGMFWRGLVKPVASTLKNLGLRDVGADLQNWFSKAKVIKGAAQKEGDTAVSILNKWVKELGEDEAMKRWNRGLHRMGISANSPSAQMKSLEALLLDTTDPVEKDAIRYTFNTTVIGDTPVARFGKVYTGRSRLPELEGGIVLPETSISVNDLREELARFYEYSDANLIIKSVEKEVPVTYNKEKTPMAEFVGMDRLRTALRKELPKYGKMGEVVAPVAEIKPQEYVKTIGGETEGIKTVYHVTTSENAKLLNETGVPNKYPFNAFDTRVKAQQWLDINSQIKENIGKNFEIVEIKGIPLSKKGAEIPPGYTQILSKNDVVPKIPVVGVTKQLLPKSTTGFLKVPAETKLLPKEVKPAGIRIYVEGEKIPLTKIRRQAEKPVPRLITPTGGRTTDEMHEILVKNVMNNDPTISKIPDLNERRLAAEARIDRENLGIQAYSRWGQASSRQYTFNTPEEAMEAGWLPNNPKGYKDLLNAMIDQNADDAAKYMTILKNVKINEKTGMPVDPDARLREYVNDIVKKVRVTTKAVQQSEREGMESADFIKGQLDAILGTGETSESKKLYKALNAIKQFNAAKLTTSLIANAFQPLNSLLAGDLPSFARGFMSMLHMTSSPMEKVTAKEFATLAGARAGTILEPGNIFRTTQESHAYRKFINKLVAPFKWSEINLNRTHAANTGAFYTIRQFRKGNFSEVNKYLGWEDTQKAMLRGFLDENDLIKAGSNFMDYTQFGFNPLELPTAFNNEWGSTILQFKSFGYRQMKFMFNELRAGNPRMLRNLAIITAVYPPMGMAQEVLKRIVTGKALKEGLIDEDKSILGMYIEGALNTGVMSIIGDAIISGGYGGGAEFAFGPTARLIGGAFDVLGQLPEGVGDVADALAKYTTSQFGGAGRGVYNLGNWLWDDVIDISMLEGITGGTAYAAEIPESELPYEIQQNLQTAMADYKDASPEQKEEMRPSFSNIIWKAISFLLFKPILGILPSREINVVNKPQQQPTIEDFTDYPELTIGETKYKPEPTSSEYAQPIQKVGQEQNIDPSILKAILMIESRMGREENKNAVGKFGWLMGIMLSAKTELENRGIEFNLDTPEGAIDAAAKYWNLVKGRKNVDINDPGEIYIKNYETSEMPDVLKQFEYYLNAYMSVLTQNV